MTDGATKSKTRGEKAPRYVCGRSANVYYVNSAQWHINQQFTKCSPGNNEGLGGGQSAFLDGAVFRCALTDNGSCRATRSLSILLRIADCPRHFTRCGGHLG